MVCRGSVYRAYAGRIRFIGVTGLIGMKGFMRFIESERKCVQFRA